MTYPERLLSSFQELSKLVLSHESVESTLDVITELAVQAIPACDVAAVSLVRADGISTVGSTDEVAVELDAIQYQTGQGPCLDAIDKDAMWFQVDEMSTDTIWPLFSAGAADLGFESLLSFTLRVDADTLGALNLYAREKGAFAEEDRDFGAIFAAHAAVALANAQAWSGDERSREEMDDALLSQDIIGRAVGILMEKEFRSSEEALEVLHARAETLKTMLREAAQDVVATADQDREELDLPEGFTERILGRAQGEDSKRGPRLPPALILIAVLVVGGLAATTLFMNARLRDSRDAAELRREALQVALSSQEGALELSGSADASAKMVPFKGGSVFVANGLEEPAANRTYQLWLFRGNEVVAGRVFEVDEGIALVEMPEPVSAFDLVAVTVEPAGGSRKPTTDPVLESK